jgi:signal transduction histidine kinase
MAGEIEKNQKKLEQNIVELHDLLELKTEFLHIIDHQLRTPLSVMRGYLEFWRNGQYQKFPPEKQEDIKHKIVTAADQLSSIIHSMIDALEVEGGSIEVRPTEFDLGELIKEIYEVDFADKYNNKGLSYKMDVSAAPKIFSDKRYVMAIVTNLIDNAMKYTPAGEVFLRSYSDGTNAVIELSDTGIGLSEKDVSGLFQKFVRGEMAPKASPTGSGIGLYIVKQLLTAMKGDIQVYSKGRNQGTMFAVKIPIQHENNKNTVR